MSCDISDTFFRQKGHLFSFFFKRLSLEFASSSLHSFFHFFAHEEQITCPHAKLCRICQSLFDFSSCRSHIVGFSRNLVQIVHSATSASLAWSYYTSGRIKYKNHEISHILQTSKFEMESIGILVYTMSYAETARAHIHLFYLLIFSFQCV